MEKNWLHVGVGGIACIKVLGDYAAVIRNRHRVVTMEIALRGSDRLPTTLCFLTVNDAKAGADQILSDLAAPDPRRSRTRRSDGSPRP